jgi:beta-glucosidase
MWGTGASSTQCEGAAPASDWIEWERAGKAPSSGNGNGFSERYADDFEILSQLGLTHHRLSIEWARIEPQEGVHDHTAIAHYRTMLQTARDAGIHPWVCLFHFTLPKWFADLGGFLIDENRTKYWSRHVDFIADTFGDLVDGWQPVNETNYYPTAAYLGRGWSPGHNDLEEWRTVTEQMHLATAEAAVRLKKTGVPVASVFGLSTVHILDDEPASHDFIARFYASNWNAGLELFRSGVLQVADRTPIIRPDLADAFDLIGFSYYCAFGVRNGQLALYPEDAPLSPLGYTVWPEGLRLILDKLHAELPGTPLLIAEYGIGTDDDSVRAAYLSAGLDITHEAIARGVDIAGFFHWTAVDNYEWLHGFDLKFGIIDTQRNVRPSALVLQAETHHSR